jgi:hypothetical protein
MNCKIAQITRDLYIINDRLFHYETNERGTRDKIEQTLLVLRNYLVANCELLQAAAEAYTKLTEDEKRRLCDEHNLSPSLLRQKTVYLQIEIDRAKGPLKVGMYHVSASLLEMLPRELEYAQYVTEDIDAAVEMSPVLAFLQGGVA